MAAPATARAPRLGGERRRRRRGRSRLLSSLGQALVVCAFVVLVTFLLVRLVPGDPVVAVSGQRASPEVQAAMRAQLHLDDPLPQQFAAFVGDLARGDLGNSLIQRGRPVTEIIAETFPVTFSVVLGCMLIAVLVGVPLGLLAALVRKPGVDGGVRAGTTLLLATPPFFLGLLLLLVVSLRWGWLPAGGWAGRWPANLEYVILPSVALSGALIPLIVRTVRQAARDAGDEQWAEATIARGLSPLRVAFAHILPNSLLPLITLLGYTAGALLGGAVVVESVFGLPGIGQEMVNAVNLRDYPVIQGIAMLAAFSVVALNLLTDLLYTVADPRTRRR